MNPSHTWGPFPIHSLLLLSRKNGVLFSQSFLMGSVYCLCGSCLVFFSGVSLVVGFQNVQSREARKCSEKRGGCGVRKAKV